MTALTKLLINQDLEKYPEKYHHASAKVLKTLENEPYFWVKDGVSFSSIERSFCSGYTFKETHIYYATPNEVKKAFNIKNLEGRYIMPDGLFFFVKCEDIENKDICEKEKTIAKMK